MDVGLWWTGKRCFSVSMLWNTCRGLLWFPTILPRCDNGLALSQKWVSVITHPKFTPILIFFPLRSHILDLSVVWYVKTLVSFVQMNNRVQEEEQLNANSILSCWDNNFNVLKWTLTIVVAYRKKQFLFPSLHSPFPFFPLPFIGSCCVSYADFLLQGWSSFPSLGSSRTKRCMPLHSAGKSD